MRSTSASGWRTGALLVRRFLADYARNPVNLLMLVLVPAAFVAGAAGSLAQLSRLIGGTAAPGAVQPNPRLAGNRPDLAPDPDRPAQVLAGLLTNALRYTSPGGQVTVSTQPAGRDVQITVTDTGEGIGAEHLPHIFERFNRADTSRDRAHGGSGIGLTIARALLTAHGGTLTAASNGPGDGAQFTLTLPAPASS